LIFLYFLKSRHMKKSAHPMHAGDVVRTVVLAIGFLGLVMLLSYLFISGNS